MLTFLRNVETGKIDLATDAYAPSTPLRTAITRHDLKSYDDAVALAADASRDLAPRVFLACEYTNRYPRFDVVEAPKVGDDVSYAFNGDSYPCGKITKISASYRRIVATETTPDGDHDGHREHVFYRDGQTGRWVKGRTWSLVRGYVKTRNPHF
jgi:hypothetical protein